MTLGQGPWANSAIGDEPHVTVEALQKGLTVGLIATKRADFVVCAEDEMLATVVERNRQNQFDFLPVIESAKNETANSSRIIGLVEIAPYMHGAKVGGRVGTAMRPLSENNLMGADASILAFVRDADRQKCRLIVSGHEISGLVTYLEIIMANAIRGEFNDTEGWLTRLNDNRRGKIQDEIKKSQVGDGFVNALLVTQFCDKVTIIRKSPYFTLGTATFENELKLAQELRDHLAHANDYAASPDAASNACSTVRLIDKWSKELLAWPSASVRPEGTAA
jgi:hypothetical protein